MITQQSKFRILRNNAIINEIQSRITQLEAEIKKYNEDHEKASMDLENAKADIKKAYEIYKNSVLNANNHYKIAEKGIINNTKNVNIEDSFSNNFIDENVIPFDRRSEVLDMKAKYDHYCVLLTKRLKVKSDNN